MKSLPGHFSGDPDNENMLEVDMNEQQHQNSYKFSKSIPDSKKKIVKCMLTNMYSCYTLVI